MFLRLRNEEPGEPGEPGEPEQPEEPEEPEKPGGEGGASKIRNESRPWAAIPFLKRFSKKQSK